MRIRVSVLHGDVNDGLCYQRLHLPFRELDREKYDIRFWNMEDFRNADAFQTDVIVMGHAWTDFQNTIVQKARMWWRVPVVIDLDDALTHMSSDHPEFAIFQSQKVPHILQAATHCVYATESLKRLYGHLNGKITVIPNSICKRTWEQYRPIAKPHKNCFIAGWTGGQSHRSDQLHTFVPALQEFLRKHNDAKAYFHVLCPEVLRQEFGSQIIFEPNVASFLDYPAVAAAYPFSVCMVGLMDTTFNNCKSDLKLLEMSPNRIPVIASPRNDFTQHRARDLMVYAEDRSGKESTEGWLAALEFAYANPDALELMADRAHEYVMRERLSTHAAAAWDQVLTQVTQ